LYVVDVVSIPEIGEKCDRFDPVPLSHDNSFRVTSLKLDSSLRISWVSALTWVLWKLAWQPKLGDYIIVVRAVDLTGNVQDPHEDPPSPNGSSGYHSFGVTAV
jgi:hypothetical protein